MRNYFLLIAVAVLFSCNNAADKTVTETDSLEIVDTEDAAEIVPPGTKMISERIKGPARVLDTIDGKLLFTLNNNIPVTATAPKNNWYRVGLLIDITPAQLSSLTLEKGTRLIVNGEEVGEVADRIKLQSAMNSNDGPKGELIGYTSIGSIRPVSVPENALRNIINTKTPLTLATFKPFLDSYGFSESEGFAEGFKGYQLDEEWITDPSPKYRLWLLFEKEKFFGVIHSRTLTAKNTREIQLKKRGWFTILNDASMEKADSIISGFERFMSAVD